MLLKAIEKRNEDRAFQMYLMQYQHMTEKTYKSFEEFYNPQKITESDETKSVNEILEEVKNILNMNRG